MARLSKAAAKTAPSPEPEAAHVIASAPPSGAIVADTSRVPSDTYQDVAAHVVDTSGKQSRVGVAYYQETTAYYGPIPPPAMLRELDELVPGAAKQILDDAHAQTLHRMELEKSNVATRNTLSRRGQWIGGIIALVGLVGSLIVIGLGYQAGGSAIACTALISLVTVFVLGHNRQTLDLARQAKVRDQIRRGTPVAEIEENTQEAHPKQEA